MRTQVTSSLAFERCDNGDVNIYIADNYYVTVPSNIWVSAVLNMTAFSERPNDWHAFLAHHQGAMDLLQSQKTLQIIKNIIKVS